MANLFLASAEILQAESILDKLDLAKKIWSCYLNQDLCLDQPNSIGEYQVKFPNKLNMVAPKYLKSRKLNSPKGLASLIHSIMHIEYNAINLAFDHILRFAKIKGIPQQYYLDWLEVGAEEAYHFKLLRLHLNSLGYDYGDFPVHNGLWEMALATKHCPMARMALVPRLMEARGLDMSPLIIQKLSSFNDLTGANILKIICQDEISHVTVGNRWFRYFCEKNNTDPFEKFIELIKKYASGVVRGPFNRKLRLKAGFSEQEMNYLERFSN